jgi:DNA-binding protein YbaB
MLELKPFKDVRVLKNRGVVDQPSESFRIQLKTHGLNSGIVESILIHGNNKIQDVLIDHNEVSKEILEVLVEKGFNKGVKNKARQKLKSKKFRN